MGWNAVDIGLPDGATFAIALCANSDGSVIFGASDFLGTGDGHAFRWTVGTGFVDLGTLPTTAPGSSPNSIAFQCSDDGNSCVGYSSSDDAYSGFPPGTQAFIWTSTGGMVGLPFLGGGTDKGSSANGISRDGQWVTGTSTQVSGDPLTTPTYPFLWASGTGTVQLGTGEQGIGQGVNNGGTVIVGGDNTGSAPGVSWPASGASTTLVAQGTGWAVTPDGLTIVGGSSDPGGGWWWTSGTGAVVPSQPGSGNLTFFEVSNDGQFMVGGYNASGGHAAYYDRINDIFTTLPPPTDGSNEEALGLSGDGQIPVGRSFVDGVQHVVYWVFGGGLDVPIIGVEATAQVGELRIPHNQLTIKELDLIQPMVTDGNRRVSLRYSDDGGANWSNPINQTIGNIGEYETDVQWRRLGYARSRVIELSWSNEFTTALTGVFVQVEVSET